MSLAKKDKTKCGLQGQGKKPFRYSIVDSGFWLRATAKNSALVIPSSTLRASLVRSIEYSRIDSGNEIET